MENRICICDECLATNLKTLLPRLKKIDSNAHIEVGCQNYCGPGRKKSYVFLNGRAISASNEDELIRKVEQKILSMREPK